jgi:death on curing protein
MEPRWLTRAMVVALHQESLALFGGHGGLRDEGLLESALARPQNLLAYEPGTDLLRLTVAYGFGLARNHPFMDGNKRIAVLAVAVFLAINGMDFDPEEVDEVRTILYLAAGDVDEDDLAAWIGANTKPRTPGP